MAINIFKKEKSENKQAVTPKAGEVFSSSKNLAVLRSPCITEKASVMGQQGNFYMFEVDGEANKIQIKKAVEDKYKVNVLQVRTINIHRKKVRRGKTEGFKKGYKKAIVKIKEGQNIEVIAQ